MSDAAGGRAIRLAYLVNQYPKTSHSFIRREIVALEALGADVTRYTVRATSEPLPEPADEAEKGKTTAILGGGLISRAGDALATFLAHPGRSFKALCAALKLARHGDRPWLAHIAYWVEAAILARWLVRDKARHLHVHFGTNSAAVGLLAHVMSGIPWSFTVHGPEEFDRSAGIGLPAKIASASFTAAISSFGRSQLWRWAAYEDWPKINIVHCGLDRDFLGAPSTPVPPDGQLVCIGRLSEQKGQLVLLEAAALLKAKGLSFRIVLAGDGPMRGEIEKKIGQLGLQNHVSITGWLSNTEVRTQLQAARAMVLPSFAEGLPVVIMEAMALSRPVVSTYVAGIPELVVPGETGWLVPAGDATALADALQDVLKSDQAHLERLGTVARQRVAARHDVAIEAQKLMHLFQS
ncbi:glycosyltransferase [Aestuariivirga sp.]|uniref:glycosyltransferase n=1 Tax=Aestuariivirga sp. TaxID=2650926 RepID=UPI0039E5C7B7